MLIPAVLNVWDRKSRTMLSMGDRGGQSPTELDMSSKTDFIGSIDINVTVLDVALHIKR